MPRLMAYVEQAIPADAASIIRKTLGEIVGGAKGSLLSIGALAALWAASGGLAAMMTALSVTYDVQDSRPWWKRKLIAVVLTIALAIVLLSAAVMLVFGGPIGGFLGNTVGMGDLAVRIWSIAQWPLAVVFLVAGIALLYYAGPAVEHRKWYWVTPGSLVATIGWIVISLGLRFYVSHFSNYSATYGSIAGVILLLLWLYLTGLVLLVGAEVNAEIEHAAAARGAPTAKAKGETVPGIAGVPAQGQSEPDRALHSKR
jgi:membrane protein